MVNQLIKLSNIYSIRTFLETFFVINAEKYMYFRVDNCLLLHLDNLLFKMYN